MFVIRIHACLIPLRFVIDVLVNVMIELLHLLVAVPQALVINYTLMNFNQSTLTQAHLLMFMTNSLIRIFISRARLRNRGTKVSLIIPNTQTMCVVEYIVRPKCQFLSLVEVPDHDMDFNYDLMHLLCQFSFVLWISEMSKLYLHFEILRGPRPILAIFSY